MTVTSLTKFSRSSSNDGDKVFATEIWCATFSESSQEPYQRGHNKLEFLLARLKSLVQFQKLFFEMQGFVTLTEYEYKNDLSTRYLALARIEKTCPCKRAIQ